ncbi:MAG: hypothetical protein ACR2MP_00080 [Streptosporangiaceae bacterium]
MSSVFALIPLTCAILAGCTGASPSGTNRAATPAPSQFQASGAHHAGPLGTAGNPLVLTCAAEAFPGYPDRMPSHPQLSDLVIGSLYIAGGKMLATESPAQYGYASYGHGGRFYKMGLVLAKGTTATVTIAPPARGHVVIAPWGGGATSITYHSCPHAQGFFAQGFAFTHRPTRGCVPLDVTIGNGPPVRHVTLSLFAGSCAQ